MYDTTYKIEYFLNILYRWYTFYDIIESRWYFKKKIFSVIPLSIKINFEKSRYLAEFLIKLISIIMLYYVTQNIMI